MGGTPSRSHYSTTLYSLPALLRRTFLLTLVESDEESMWTRGSMPCSWTKQGGEESGEGSETRKASGRPWSGPLRIPWGRMAASRAPELRKEGVP